MSQRTGDVVILLITLQIAIVGYAIARGTAGESATLPAMKAMITPAATGPGAMLPAVPAFDVAGERVSLLTQDKAQTVIFSNCSCDLADAASFAAQAAQRGEAVTVVLRCAPSRLDYYKSLHKFPGRVVAMRQADANALKGQGFPLALVVAPSGVINSRLK